MKIFVHEYITGGGLLEGRFADASFASLRPEGLAMVTALASDFASLPGVEVQLLSDPRFPVELPGCHVCSVSDISELREAFATAAGDSDWTVVIAPETEGTLQRFCRCVVTVGGRLLGPDPDWVAWASDKHRTMERLGDSGIPIPNGLAISRGAHLPDDFDYPAVLKRRDGAGSANVQLLKSLEEARAGSPTCFDARLERYVPGAAASVAVLSGSAGTRMLRPCWQCLSTDGTFQYRGGTLIEDDAMAGRATRLAQSTVGAVPAFAGFIGIDMILAEDPADDVVVEINPRLTTSYVVHRDAGGENLAAVMLGLVGDKEA